MCKVGKEKFVEVVEKEGDLEFVTEHVIGDGKGASKELWEGLQNHFMGECTEVGMYLAMSRQADREGSLNCWATAYGTPRLTSKSA